MSEIKIGDKMFLTNEYETLVGVLVTKITNKRIYFAGSHFYTFVNYNETTRRLHKTLEDAKEHLIRPLRFKIHNYQEEIKRIESL